MNLTSLVCKIVGHDVAKSNFFKLARTCCRCGQTFCIDCGAPTDSSKSGSARCGECWEDRAAEKCL